MNSDQWIKILPLTISLLQAIIWPFVVLTIVLYLRKPIKKFFENMGELSVKAGPVETIVKQRTEVAASLAVAVATEQKQNSGGINQTESTREVAALVNQLITPQTSKRFDGTTALWVDDRPSNNTFQRNALEALGMRFTICTSTEDAIKELQARNFNIIISDLVRFDDKYAGYILLEKVKEMHITTPFILYAAGGNRPERKEEAIKRGAFRSVSGPQALFEAVIQAIDSESQHR